MTAAEIATRRSESAIKRKHLTEKKLEDDKVCCFPHDSLSGPDPFIILSRPKPSTDYSRSSQRAHDARKRLKKHSKATGITKALAVHQVHHARTLLLQGPVFPASDGSQLQGGLLLLSLRAIIPRLRRKRKRMIRGLRWCHLAFRFLLNSFPLSLRHLPHRRLLRTHNTLWRWKA